MNRLVISIQSLGVQPSAAIVSIATLTLGNLWSEHERLRDYVQSLKRGEPELANVHTVPYYASFGVHARQMVEAKQCTADQHVVEAWGMIDPEDAQPFHDEDQEWLDVIQDVGNMLIDADEIWVLNKHEFIPIWKHWCTRHVMPHRVRDDKFRDAATLLSLYQDTPTLDLSYVPHSMSEALELGVRIECALAKHTANNQDLL